MRLDELVFSKRVTARDKWFAANFQPGSAKLLLPGRDIPSTVFVVSPSETESPTISSIVPDLPTIKPIVPGSPTMQSIVPNPGLDGNNTNTLESTIVRPTSSVTGATVAVSPLSPPERQTVRKEGLFTFISSDSDVLGSTEKEPLGIVRTEDSALNSDRSVNLTVKGGDVSSEVLGQVACIRLVSGRPCKIVFPDEPSFRNHLETYKHDGALRQ